MTILSDYTLENELQDNQVTFSFNGYFRKKPVIWHIHLSNQNLNPENSTSRQYITIYPGENTGHMNAEIYLKIKKIKTSDIVKTIIMISQYRQLKVGTHYYGEID